MIRLFVRLKLALLKNMLWESSGKALVVFTVVSWGLSYFAVRYVLGTNPVDHRWLAPAGTFAVSLGWIAGPMLFGASDETVDTTRIALLPLRGRELVPGVLAASLTGPGPIAVAAPLLALAYRPLRDQGLAGASRAAVIVLAGMATLLFAVVASRLILTMLGNALRRRSRRDLATLIAGVGAGLMVIGSQVLRLAGFDSSTVRAIGRSVRWLPGGWTGDAAGRVADGGSLITPLALIFLTLGVTFWLATLWSDALTTALTDVSDGSVNDRVDAHMIQTARWGWTSWFPEHRRADIELLRLVMAKELRYLRRHPRYRIQVATQGVVLVLGGAPFITALLQRDQTSVLFGCIPALTAGITSANLFGSDGRALWGEVVALPSLKPILRGRSLTFALLGVAASAFVTLGSAIYTGGWRYVPVALGAAIGMALTGAGVGAFTSTLAPSNLPDDNNPNPFATEAAGHGFLGAIITFTGVVFGLVLAGPILGGLSVAKESTLAGLFVLTTAPFYGALLYALLTNSAASRSDKRAPELVASLA